jgi:tRNA(Ile2)-agmatinylcytidine synthase
MLTMHVGIDDTDSPRKGCTTYVTALLVEKLSRLGVSFIDYLNLVRLNPNVPWKTRGNGALCLRFRCEEKLAAEIMELVIDTVEKNSDIDYEDTDPGVVFFCGSQVPEELTVFAKQTIQGLVRLQEALKLVRLVGAEAVGFNSGRGIIGALAAVGETLTGDHTYELIAYRMPENYGTPRRVDAASVELMDKKTAPLTFNNFDFEKGRVLITPRGPDPILYGIRGENPDIVKRAHSLVRALEPIERWTIFRTNQGTDAHLRQVYSIDAVFPYQPVIVNGIVTRNPQIIPRRHVVFSISDKTGEIDCAAYEPTQDLRKAAQLLIVDDMVEAFGGVRPKSGKRPVTVNLEKLNVVKLASKVVFRNPLCSRCSKHMESMGAGQGFRCKRCGFRSSTLKKQAVEEKRALKTRLYVTSVRSQRHLTKPLNRYGLEKSGKPKRMISDWFGVNV